LKKQKITDGEIILKDALARFTEFKSNFDMTPNNFISSLTQTNLGQFLSKFQEFLQNSLSNYTKPSTTPDLKNCKNFLDKSPCRDSVSTEGGTSVPSDSVSRSKSSKKHSARSPDSSPKSQTKLFQADGQTLRYSGQLQDS
jgi:hypothetical protein